MRASPYNNPLFADGLATLVDSYVGNPQSVAQAELMAARALNERLTAQYRQGMDVGLQANGQNLSDMMVRALQAGSEYSGNAPKISAAINQNDAGMLGALIRSASSGGRTGGGGGKSGADPVNPLDAKRIAEFIPEEYVGTTAANEALRDALAQPDPTTAILEAVTGLSTTEATPDTNWLPWVDNSKPAEYTYTSPFATAAPAQPVGQPEVQLLNEAREAIKMGADAAAVRKRLAEMGVDASQL